jgi:4-amino-4-deoxy-L-arabinose transferase-like glycosyltransferase
MSWKVQRWVLLAVVGVYVAMRVYRGAAICMDGDEIFSVGVAEHDWMGLLRAVGQDSIHPPLFYFLLKIWIAIGSDSLFWTRLLPTLFSTLAIVPMVLLGREFQLRPVAITSTVGMAAIHPYLLYYSQHVRMYTLLMLCALTSLWAFHACMRPGTRSEIARFVVLTLVNIVSVNSHYYGWLVIGLECGYLLLWKREYLKRMALSCAVVFVGFLPWMFWAGKYIRAKGGLASNLEWIQKPDAGALAWFFVDLAGFGDFPSIGRQAVTGLVVLVLAAGYAAWRERAKLHAGHFVYMARFLLYFVLGSVAVAFTASRLLPNSVWGHRHMVYLVFPMLMLVTAAYYQLNSVAFRIAAGVLCAVWAGMVIQHHLKGDDKKTPFDALVIQMLAQEADNPNIVPFYSVDKYLHYPVWFYLETLKAGKITGFARPFPPADRARLAADASRIQVKNHVSIDDAKGPHFWVAYSSAWQEKLTPEEILSARGCRVGGDVTVRDRYHWSTIFPAWCGE